MSDSRARMSDSRAGTSDSSTRPLVQQDTMRDSELWGEDCDRTPTVGTAPSVGHTQPTLSTHVAAAPRLDTRCTHGQESPAH